MRQGQSEPELEPAPEPEPEAAAPAAKRRLFGILGRRQEKKSSLDPMGGDDEEMDSR
jgi:hypothetical protein